MLTLFSSTNKQYWIEITILTGMIVSFSISGCSSLSPQPTPISSQQDIFSTTATRTETPRQIIPPTPSLTPTPIMVSRWMEYENALSNALLAGVFRPTVSESEKIGLCEWSILGQTDQEIYVWAECQIADSNLGDAAANSPAVIRLSTNGEIEEVVLPGEGRDYGPDILLLFPQDVVTKIDSITSFFDARAAMEHIALRRRDSTIPPLIVEANTPLP